MRCGAELAEACSGGRALSQMKSGVDLRRVGIREIWVRGRQAVASTVDRLGSTWRVRAPSELPLVRLVSPSVTDKDPGSAGAHAMAEVRAAFLAGAARLPGLADIPGTAAAVRTRFGDAGVLRLRAQADRIVAGELDLLGYRGLDFGDPIEWHLDPTTGVRSPLRHWSRIRYLDRSVAGDKKVVWELNRLQHLLTLARAFAVTGDERYARVIAQQLDSWIAGNPPGRGINWASSLEVAYRSIAWLWVLALTARSSALKDVFERSIPTLWQHGRHIETYLSTYFSPNTHLSGEALGLVYLGSMLPVRDAERWLSLGRRILLRCLDWHVRSDGVYFEQSTYYHAYTVDIYTQFWLLADSGDRDRIRGPLVALLDFLLHAQRPDGSTPQIGDDDGGRLLPLGPGRGNDFRYALSTGAVLMGRADLKHGASELAEETLWLLGPEAATTFDALDSAAPTDLSKAFPDGGYYIQRDGWDGRSNYLIIDCGPHGGLQNYGHAHADALSFELCANGEPLIVDAGTYTYTGSAADRDRFRTTLHNTLLIDGLASSEPSDPFHWRSAAHCRARVWWSCDRADLFVGEHDGFARIESGLVHERSVLFLKPEYWLIRDRVRGCAHEHGFELAFQCAPGAVAALDGCLASISSTAGAGPDLVLATTDTLTWRVEAGAVAPVYGASMEAPRLVLGWRASGDWDTLTLALPRNWSSADIVRPHAQGGVSVTLRHGEIEDQIVAGPGSDLLQTDRLATDANLLWVRLVRGELSELIISGGSYARVEGRDAVSELDPRQTEHRRWVGGTEQRTRASEPCAGSVA